MPQVELKTLYLTEPFRIAHGSCSRRDVLRLHENGAVGEAPFVPYYDQSPEQTIAWLAGDRSEGGSSAGRLALDLLRLDQAPAPLWKEVENRLGSGRAFGEVQGCRSLSIPTDLGSFAEKVRETAQQFRVLKLKLGSGDLSHDRAVVAVARDAAPHATIFADVNGGWSVDQTVQMFPHLRSHRLVLVEQPVHHELGIGAWKELKAKTPPNSLPVFADESVRNADDVRELAEWIQGVNVKLVKCGSFSGAIEMIRTARELNLGVILGCMIESSIGVTAAAHLAPWADFVDLDGHLYLSNDDYEGITFTSAGQLVMPSGNGIGVRPKSPLRV